MSNSAWVSTSVPYLRPRADGLHDAWSAETATDGRPRTQQITMADEVSPPLEVASLLNVPKGEVVIVRRRIMHLDEQPVELTDSYYPAYIARGTRLAEPSKIPGGAVTLLAQLGYTGQRAQEEVAARLPSSDEQSALAMSGGEPVLTLTRLVLDSDDRPIQVDVITMRAQRQRLRYELRIG